VYAVGVLAPVLSVELLPRLTFALASAGVSTLVVYALRRTAIARWLAVLGIRSMSIYVGQFLFVQLVFVHSWFNAVLTTVLAVAGSLLIDRVFASNRWTNTVFLGGRGRPRVVPAAEGLAA
jgi:uncharacterized membrane protein YeiB